MAIIVVERGRPKGEAVFPCMSCGSVLQATISDGKISEDGFVVFVCPVCESTITLSPEKFRASQV